MNSGQVVIVSSNLEEQCMFASVPKSVRTLTLPHILSQRGLLRL